MFCLIPPTWPYKSSGHLVVFLPKEIQGPKLLGSCELMYPWVFSVLLPANGKEEEDWTKHTCFLLHWLEKRGNTSHISTCYLIPPTWGGLESVASGSQISNHMSVPTMLSSTGISVLPRLCKLRFLCVKKSCCLLVMEINGLFSSEVDLCRGKRESPHPLGQGENWGLGSGRRRGV